MKVSILICTKNRERALRETFESLARVLVPRCLSVEILVVDNGSSDGTRELVKGTRFSWGVPKLLEEGTPGVASARNRAMDFATGDVLLWTDDDVRLPENWIGAMVDPIRQGSVDAVAGGVRLAEGRDRSWMGPCLRSWLASSEGLNGRCPGRMIGANMAFHRRVVASGLRFDPALGPGALGMGEETLLSYQMVSRGFRIGARLDVEVRHAFDPGRLCATAMASLARSMGRSEGYIAHHWHGLGEARGSGRLLDAQLRHGYWQMRAYFQRKAPSGLLERELQALARVHYWDYLQSLQGTPRKYRFDRRVVRIFQKPVPEESAAGSDCLLGKFV